MARIIPILTTSIDDKLGPSLFNIYRISSIVNSNLGGEIVFDFSKCKFLDLMSMAGIHGICEYLKQRNVEISFQGISSELDTFFGYNKFYDGLSLTTNIDDNLILRYKSKRYTPFFKFPIESAKREVAVNTILSIIESQTSMPALYKMAVDYFISEFANNISEHSKSDFGTIVTQTYPSINCIDICIFDTGIGIYNSYQSSLKFKPLNESEAIELAINGASTKDIPESRGFGISTSRNMITNGLNGKFILWSGKSSYFQSKTHKENIITDSDFYFQGCFIILRIPLQIPSKFDFYQFVQS